MRKFFTFKSSGSTNEKSSGSTNEKSSGSTNGNKSPPSLDSAADNKKVYWEKPLKKTDDTPSVANVPRLQHAKAEVHFGPQLRRSASFSSPAVYTDFGCHAHDVGAVQQLQGTDSPNSPTSSSIRYYTSGNSTRGSPVPLRCRSSRMQQATSNNRVLDLYIDGEHPEIKATKDTQSHFADSQANGCLTENKVLSSMGRPPRALSTAPSSPTYTKEKMQSCSFRETKNTRHHLFIPEHAADDYRPTTPVYNTRRKFEQQHPLRGKPSRDYDSETMTSIGDNYDDSFNPWPASTSASISAGVNTDNSLISELQKHSTDEALISKMKEAERMLKIIFDEDHELEKLETKNLNTSTLLQTIRIINEDRRYLALELASQIKCLISDRSSTTERLKQAKLEVDARTRRLEQEKSELQSSLENELDRRSSDWSSKLQKIQSEEQRLRERVRELAEQNVSLQREVSALKTDDVGSRSKIMNSQIQLNDLATSLDLERTKNRNLNQALTELQESSNETKEDRNHILQSLKEKEKENAELQKLVIQFKRICSEQDKTIDGLRQRYSNERDDEIGVLRMEQIRLTGVEQMLRKELHSSRNEAKSLRHENICLLEQGTKTRFGLSSIKLDQELHDRVDYLQNQGLSLLNDHSQLFGKMLELVKRKQRESNAEATVESDGYSLGDYTIKYQNLRRGNENFRRSLSAVAELLEKSSNLDDLDWHLQSREGVQLRQSEDELEIELKAETLLNRVLREKLFSKELEVEQLQSDLSSSILSHEVLKTEVQRLQDELTCITHKMKDMELQMLNKDESIHHIEHELQKCKKELTSTCSMLKNVTEERDRMWEEVKDSKETIMRLNREVNSLKKKVEDLEECILIKEGEISILKDILATKPLDSIYS